MRNALLAATILLVGCANATKPDEPRTGVQSAIDTYRAALNEGDSTAFFALLSDSIEVLPPGMAGLKGENARAMFRGLFNGDVKPTIDAFTNQELIGTGDWVTQRYDYHLSLRPKDGGVPMVESGSGMHVWHFDTDGKWRIQKDIWTSVPTPSDSAK